MTYKHKRLSIKVSEEMYEYIKDKASKEGLSMNAIIIFALNNYKTQDTVVPSMDTMKQLLGRLDEES